jgi:hypothetical protein
MDEENTYAKIFWAITAAAWSIPRVYVSSLLSVYLVGMVHRVLFTIARYTGLQECLMKAGIPGWWFVDSVNLVLNYPVSWLVFFWILKAVFSFFGNVFSLRGGYLGNWLVPLLEGVDNRLAEFALDVIYPMDLDYEDSEPPAHPKATGRSSRRVFRDGQEDDTSSVSSEGSEYSGGNNQNPDGRDHIRKGLADMHLDE